MSVARLQLAPVGETMFPSRAPFFQRPSLLGEPPGSAQAGSVAGQAGDARPANRGACGAPRPPPHSSTGGRSMSWAAHDLEPYAIQRHMRLKVAFVPLLIGSYSPDMMSKWFVYG